MKDLKTQLIDTLAERCEKRIRHIVEEELANLLSTPTHHEGNGKTTHAARELETYLAKGPRTLNQMKEYMGASRGYINNMITQLRKSGRQIDCTPRHGGKSIYTMKD